jgi:hypothetical protein
MIIRPVFFVITPKQPDAASLVISKRQTGKTPIVAGPVQLRILTPMPARTGDRAA